MRTVSFVEHLEFDCQGNVFSKAITVGDVDNDQVRQKQNQISNPGSS